MVNLFLTTGWCIWGGHQNPSGGWRYLTSKLSVFLLPTPISAEFHWSHYSWCSSYRSGWIRGCSHNHSSYFTQNKDVAVDGFSRIFFTIPNYPCQLIESLIDFTQIRCDLFIWPICTFFLVKNPFLLDWVRDCIFSIWPLLCDIGAIVHLSCPFWLLHALIWWGMIW